MTFPDQRYQQPEPDQQRRLIVRLTRAVFLILLITFTALIIVKDSTSTGELEGYWPYAVVGVLFFFFLCVAVDYLTPQRKLATISAVFVGLIVAFILIGIISMALDLFSDIYEYEPPPWLQPSKIILGMGIVYLTVTTVLQTQDDFRLVIPYVEFTKKFRGARPYLLDSAALIDGRVLDIAEVGVFQSPMIVPRFVLDELQRLGDSSDKMKRARGRRGLDMVAKLQRSAKVEVTIEELDAPGAGVDQKLVQLARDLPATVVTTDLGLVRVAGIEGASVLNINDLANAMKPLVIPGEPLSVHLLRKGEQPGQAIGYLQDGTMVIAEDGEPLIGQEAILVVTSTTQTKAGRLIFGKPLSPDHPHAPAPSQEQAHAPQVTPNPAPTLESTSTPPAPGPGPGPTRSPRRTTATSLRNPRRGS